MSDNKYIIDKDSLTGIADAVRDKLGTGEATTDSQTGDIIYPEDKGYYLKQIIIAKWEKQEFTDTWDGTGTSYVTRANVTEEQLLRVCNGVRPVYVKIDAVLTSASSDGILVENSLTSWNASNHIVTLPTSGRFYCQYFYYHQSYYSGRYFQKTIPAITFSFLDENQKIIIPENASKIVDESYNRNLLQESVEMSIPFSIDDIQNKITNYLTSNAVQAFSFNGYYQNSPYQPYVNLSSIFSSRQDLLNRLYNVCVWGLPGTLLIGADGHPVSMRKEGVALPSNIVSGIGGWDVTDVPTAYNNDQIFRYHFKDPNLSGNAGDTQLAYIYVPSSVTNPFIIFCLDNTIGYSLGSGNSRIIMYRSA